MMSFLTVQTFFNFHDLFTCTWTYLNTLKGRKQTEKKQNRSHLKVLLVLVLFESTEVQQACVLNYKSIRTIQRTSSLQRLFSPSRNMNKEKPAAVHPSGGLMVKDKRRLRWNCVFFVSNRTKQTSCEFGRKYKPDSSSRRLLDPVTCWLFFSQSQDCTHTLLHFYRSYSALLIRCGCPLTLARPTDRAKKRKGR